MRAADFQQHDPRPDRRGHQAHPRVPRRPGQPGRLRQLGRVAGDVAGAAEEVPGGRARGGQPPGLETDGPRLRAAPDAGRDRPRQVLREADHRLLQAAEHRLRRLLPRRLALSAPRRPRQARATLASLAAAKTASARSTSPPSGRRSRKRRKRSGRWPSCRRCGASCRARTGDQRRRASARAAPRMRDYVVQLRKKLEFTDTPDPREGARRNGAAVPMWRNRQYASHRMSYDARRCRSKARNVGGRAREAADRRARRTVRRTRQPVATARGESGGGRMPTSMVPAGQRAPYEAAFGRFARSSPTPSTSPSAAATTSTRPGTPAACSAPASTT